MTDEITTKLTVMRLAGSDTLVIKKNKDSKFFITTPDAIIISVTSLSTIINFLVQNGQLRPGTLAGILEEYHTA